MGRDWSWGGGRSSKNGARTAFKDIDKDSLSSNSTGCMCSVFQIFDFHQFQFPNSNQPPSSSLTQDSFLPEDPPTKGNEAPRNSLELDNPTPLLTTVKPDECLHIPMGIQVKTNGGQNDSCSSEISSSPSTKTPNLVARLMGLDILPHQCHSPTSTLTTPKSHSHRRHSFHGKTGTRSLPETPRISSARKSDVEHRLSLQINKENIAMSPSEELVKRRDLKIRTADEENRSPGHYARQIMKQVKESVSRRVGSDITNTVKSRNEIPLKSKKITATKLDYDCSNSNSNSRIKFMNKDQNGVVLTKPRLQQRPKMAEERLGPQPKLKKPPQTSEIIRNKKEEPFVRSTSTTATKIPDKKCKKSPLSNDVVPTILPIKKDPIPPATKIPQKQALPNLAQESKRSSQLSSCSSHSYKQQETIHIQKNTTTAPTQPDSRGKNHQYSSNGVVSAIAGVQREEFEYITRILKCTAINKSTPVSFTRWFSPSHPIDPSIFHYLEFFTPKKSASFRLSHRCNRKLIFHLVDEILAGILRPYMNIKPWVNPPSSNLKGEDLIDVLCAKVRSFPGADCRVLEDIDGLIEKDLAPLKDQSDLAFGEEGEVIVMEVEKDLLDSLIHETTLMLYGN